MAFVLEKPRSDRRRSARPSRQRASQTSSASSPRASRPSSSSGRASRPPSASPTQQRHDCLCRQLPGQQAPWSYSLATNNHPVSP
eukprot:1875796-Rhodomonas_salina.2